MRAHVQQRLQDLQQEYQRGQARLHELEQAAAQLRDTLLRISGAIQVLEEVISSATAPPAHEAAASAAP